MAGRQRRVAGGRTVVVKVKVTPEQHADLKAQAARLKVSVPRLMVDSALSPTGLTIAERHGLWRELEGVGRLLSAVGNNVNQIARALNSGGRAAPGEVAAASAAVSRISERLGAVLAALPAAPSTDEGDLEEQAAAP